jgi:hypothetical protein
MQNTNNTHKSFVFFAFLFFKINLIAQSFTISGKITDIKSGEPILFADCFDEISFKGTNTNAYGIYSLSLPKGTIQLTVSHINYEKFTKQIFIDKDTLINLSLQPIVENLDEVVIQHKIPIHKQTLMGKINIPVQSVKEIPSFAGETDLMKALTYLPGITNGKEGYSNIFVRGGDRGQNLILLDGMKLYNTNHIGGFLSLINSDILKHIDIYKGGFPARYGGRASSVIDLYTIDGNKKKFGGKFNLGLLTSSFLLEGPLTKKVSFFSSARSSYYDLFTLKKRRVYNKTGREGYFGYTIFDINTKIYWEKTETNNFSLSFYTGHDFQSTAEEVINNQKSLSHWKIHNTGVSLNQLWNFHPKWFIKNTLAFSNYKTTLENIEEDNFSFYKYNTISNINDLSFQSRISFSPNTKHNIKGGVEASYYIFKPGVQTIESENQNENYTNTSGFISYINAFETNFYIEDEIKLSKKTRLNIGARYSVYKAKDTVYKKLEPRISLRMLINNNLSFKANYTEMNQFNHTLVNNYFGFERELWLASTKNIPPQKAKQLSGGLFYSSNDNIWNFSLETYFKKMSNLLVYQSPVYDEENLSNIENITAKNGKGNAYGIETQIERNSDQRFNGSINYTLSWNYRKFETLNEGIKYPSNYDRRHNLSVLANYKIDSYYTLSTNFNLSSGTPITMPIAYISEDDYNYGYFVYDKINNYRLPLYHRMDIAISRTKKNRKNKKRIVQLNIYNAYARQNPVYIYLDSNTGKVKQKSLFSIIPTLNYTYEF